MPSIAIDLPANVERRARADGTYRYYFRVKRKRPQDWPAVLRFDAFDTEGVIDEKTCPARFAAALEKWATQLNDRLAASRGNCSSSPELARGSLPWVWARYQEEDRYGNRAKKTKDNYKNLARYVTDWSRHLGHPHVGKYTYLGVKAFVDGWSDSPFQRRAVQRFLSLLFHHAIRLKLREDNPAAKLGLEVPESEICIWEEPELNFMVTIADAIGQRSMGTAIMIVHEIGQREGDILKLSAPLHYDSGMFSFAQNKTKKSLRVPATQSLQDRFAKVGVPLHRKLIQTDAKGVDWKEDHFRHVFRKVRATAGAVMAVQMLAEVIGGHTETKFIDVTRLVYRQLRHTAVVNLARAGCTIPEIASVTGHSLQTVTYILKHYLPADSVVAAHAIRKLEHFRNSTG